jgi:hypothetical protein
MRMFRIVHYWFFLLRNVTLASSYRSLGGGHWDWDFHLVWAGFDHSCRPHESVAHGTALIYIEMEAAGVCVCVCAFAGSQRFGGELLAFGERATLAPRMTPDTLGPKSVGSRRNSASLLADSTLPFIRAAMYFYGQHFRKLYGKNVLYSL